MSYYFCSFSMFFARFLGVRLFCVALLGLILAACQDKAQNSSNDSNFEPDALVGCYALDQNEPAQIKIDHVKSGFIMQMKEPKDDGVNVWDSGESLQVLNTDKGWEYFKSNALDLNKDDVLKIIARPDGMMALAQVKASAKNINPRLDSPYVMYIVQGSNTVYQVSCHVD
ncbi:MULTISPECIES: hypothetical protein [unclassified Moraxella]|uniref:hypothetical protein n=1 Tax=unclassified Moraxella TaxID=2685852 RepID=UPI002B411436|nr:MULTISPECIES: hypothetical protein [unclassified Moraxella]